MSDQDERVALLSSDTNLTPLDASSTSIPPSLNEDTSTSPGPAPAVASHNLEEKVPAPRSRFDAGGVEEHAGLITQILTPVCITMIIVIAIVKGISFPWQDQVSAAMAYIENPDDSGGTKLVGSLINAAIFVVLIGGVTFLFVCLYKYRCMKIIYGWLFMSTTLMLGSMGGFIFYQILLAINIPMDYFTFVLILWNFAIVGIASIFWHSAVIVNQVYLIAVSVIMATVFTRLPEWTTWAILAALAVYDLAAVLCTLGPLRLLVEMAQERDEPLPALIYNASATIQTGNLSNSDDSNSSNSDDNNAQKSESDNDDLLEDPTDNESVYKDDETGGTSINSLFQDNKREPLESAVPVPEHDEDDEESQNKGVKLGLGDFIFYSVLVGRAAMFDMMTVFTSFVGIVTGLFCTIMLLAVWRKALPALPISIFFGIIFYILTKIFLYPFMLTALLNGVVF